MTANYASFQAAVAEDELQLFARQLAAEEFFTTGFGAGTRFYKSERRDLTTLKRAIDELTTNERRERKL